MNRLYIFIIIVLLGLNSAYGQAPSRRNMKEQKESNNTLSVRAKSQYSYDSDEMENVRWKRDIYRTLDLDKAENSALYYPERPLGDNMNLFSLIFKLAIEKRIKIYEYNIDGNENFSVDNVISPQDMLDRFGIYYREKLLNRKDTLIVIDNSDVPSNEVKSYFVKEVNYFDERTSNMKSIIEAICPILHRTDEFTYENTKYPMFWVRFKDLEPYLTQTTVMTSDYNNVASFTLSDFFAAKMYVGDIYKTTNRLNRTLAQYCPTDSLLKAEQEKIEQQLVNFENGLWDVKVSNKKEDNIAGDKDNLTDDKKNDNSKRIGRDESDKESNLEEKNSKKKEVKKKKTTSSASKSAPRASVRRERR